MKLNKLQKQKLDLIGKMGIKPENAWYLGGGLSIVPSNRFGELQREGYQYISRVKVVENGSAKAGKRYFNGKDVGYLCTNYEPLKRQLQLRGNRQHPAGVTLRKMIDDYQPVLGYERVPWARPNADRKQAVCVDIARNHAKMVAMNWAGIWTKRPKDLPHGITPGIAFVKKHGYSGDAPVFAGLKKWWKQAHGSSSRICVEWGILIGPLAHWAPVEAGYHSRGWGTRSTRYLLVGIDWILANIPKQ